MLPSPLVPPAAAAAAAAARSDMLGNLRLPGSGTIVEIQVTTVPMLSLKSSVAHGVYRIGRESSASLNRRLWLGAGGGGVHFVLARGYHNGGEMLTWGPNF